MNDEPKAIAKRIQDGIDSMRGEIAVLRGIIVLRERIHGEALAALSAANDKLKALQQAVEEIAHNGGISAIGLAAIARDALAKSKE